jgi:hypothetical protein
MRSKVNNNITRINNNSDTIKEIISKEPPSPNREEKLRVLYADNKHMFAENNALLEIQKRVVEYKSNYVVAPKNNTYYDKKENAIVEELTYEECFYKTIDDSIPLNNEHPMIESQSFLNELLQYYNEHELYEKCPPVVKYLDKLNMKNQEQWQTRETL